MKYNLFIGRFQSPHKGHQVIFDSFLKKGMPILIAIRNVPCDDKNPLSSQEIQNLWQKIYENNPLVETMIIPDIESVNYGRGVGYSVNEIQVTQDVASISATDIRKKIIDNDESWKPFVDEKIHELLPTLIKKINENNILY